MSPASQRDDWGGIPPEADFLVRQVEDMTLEGLYGARVLEGSRCVLVVGKPFSLPEALDRLAEAFTSRFGEEPQALLL